MCLCWQPFQYPSQVPHEMSAIACSAIASKWSGLAAWLCPPPGPDRTRSIRPSARCSAPFASRRGSPRKHSASRRATAGPAGRHVVRHGARLPYPSATDCQGAPPIWSTLLGCIMWQIAAKYFAEPTRVSRDCGPGTGQVNGHHTNRYSYSWLCRGRKLLSRRRSCPRRRPRRAAGPADVRDHEGEPAGLAGG